jgi:hypothetical protein
MIDFIVNSIFKWNRLRTAIFAEVDLYNSIGITLKDPEASATASLMWFEQDGWRGWTIRDNGSYYFNDIPESNLTELCLLLDEADKA